MKKFLCTILTICMVFSTVFAVPAFAETASGECGENLTWVLTDDGTLTISGSGDMTSWTSTSSVPWISYRSAITSVVIDSGVTSIGTYAFYNCTGLTSVEIPDSMTSIGKSAFYKCTGLTSVVIPNSVTSLEERAFESCSGLTNVTIPDGVTSMGQMAFYNCTGLTSVTIGSGVTSIGKVTFYGCTGLTSIVISSSVTSIESSAFYNCSSLTDVYYFGNEADWANITIGSGNNPLTNANIHYNSTSMPTITASGECGESLTWVLEDDGTLKISGTGDMTSWTSYTSMPWYSYLTSIKSVVIDSGVTSIGQYAFRGCSSLTSIKIPKSVTSIGNYTFESCTGLTSAEIPDGVTNIGNYAFENCSSLTSVTIPKSVTSTGNYTFYGCSGLTSAEILDGVTSIGYGVFYNCSSLTILTIPNSVTSIGNGAFYGCSGLTELTIPNSVTSIGNSVFSSCRSLTSVEIPDGVTSIGNGAFKNCSSLTSVEIPDGVTSIGKSAFENCSSLTSVEIPGSVTSIGDNAFSSCSGLTDVYYIGSTADWANITIGTGNDPLTNAAIYYALSSGECGENLRWILTYDGTLKIRGTGDMTNWTSSSSMPWYSSLTNIKFVVIDSGVTSIGDYAFYNCSNLTSAEIPDGVTSVGEYAFYRCTGLINVKIPGSVTIIGYSSFTGCSGLMEFEIGSSVTSIDNNVFWNCNDLTDVYYVGSEADWANITIGSGNDRLTNANIHYNSSMPTIIAIGECGTNLTWFLKDDGTLIIRGTGDMTNWDSYTSVPWYSYRSDIKSVLIDSGVTSIGASAFFECSSLTELTIPNSVTSVGGAAFRGCSSLKIVEIPNSVTNIGYGAFPYCSSLTSINVDLSNNNYSSENGVLFNKNKTELVCYPGGKSGSYIIPNSVTSIGQYAFWGCRGLTDLEIGSNVTSIGDKAFLYCSGLSDLEIPSSVTSIGDNAFYGCSSLTDVYYAGSEADWANITIGTGNDPLTNATIHYALSSGECGTNLTWVLKDDGTLTISGTGDMTNWTSYSSVPWYSYQSSIKSVVIDSGVTSIGQYAFRDCSSLTDVAIPNSVTSIEACAFQVCSGLTKLTIPDSVTSIGEGAFTGCSGLTDVYYAGTEADWANITIGNYNEPLTNATIHYVLSSGECGTNLTWVLADDGTLTISGSGDMTSWDYLTSVPWHIYKLSIKSVVIDSEVKSIGSWAFAYCDDLTSVTIPNSVTSIGARAFTHCTGLTDVYYAGSKADWANITIGTENDPLTNATIHYVLSSGECGTNLTWVLKDDGTLTISGSGDMTSWASYSAVPWYSYRSSIKSVVIVSGVTSIGNNAFYGCIGLTSAAIPNSVTSIGNGAFNNCRGLKIVEIPNSVTSIGNGAFNNCRGLTELTIPNSVTSIEASAFAGCTGLTELTIPNSVTSIGNYAFDGCSSLTSVTIPNSVTRIGAYAFDDCSSLTSINVDLSNNNYSSENGVLFNKNKTELVCYPGGKSGSYIIPNSVTSIGDHAFECCSGLTSVTIPDSVTSIGAYAFYGCDGLTDVYYGGSEADWANIAIGIENELLTDATIHYNSSSMPIASGECGTNLTWVLADDGTLTISGTGDMTSWTSTSSVPWYSYRSSIKSVVIGSGVTSIGQHAFYDCSSLTGVAIPNSVTSIGEGAFESCSGLTNVEIPNSVTSIGEGAFFDCNGLTSVTISDSVTSIGQSTFYGCSSLTDLEIGSSVKSIGLFAFYGCSSLTGVAIPDSVTSIGIATFLDCSSLTDVYYAGSEADWANITIGAENEPLTNATIHYNSSMPIASGECGTNLTWVLADDGTLTISGTGDMTSWDSITSVPWYSYRSSIKSVVIDSGVTSIGQYAFRGCSGLTDVAIPNSVTSIGRGAFANCSSLKNVTIPDGVTSIGNNAFYYCSSLTKLTIPDSVTSIGEDAFTGCSSLISINVDLSNNNYSSENGVLFNKNKTELVCYPGGKSGSYIIPDGVASLGAFAFYKCTGLTSVTIPDGVTSIGNYAFYGCSSLTEITIPDSVTSIEHFAFYGCDCLTDVYYAGNEADWANITIGDKNEPLTNATIHYNCNSTVSVTIDGTETVYKSLNEAISFANESGKTAQIKLLCDLEEEEIVSDCAFKIDLGGFTVGTLSVTGNVNLANGTINTLNISGIAATENVTVTSTNAVNYGTEGTKGVYTNYTSGASMIDGAQVRIGGGVAEDGTIDAQSGLRFISEVNTADTLAADIISNHYKNSTYDEGYSIGTMITVEGSDAAAYVPATAWQNDDCTVFSAAITNLKSNNFNRKYTAQTYVEYNGVKFINNDKTTRSMYQVAAGLLAQSSEEDAQKLVAVLNAYVNQTGIRLVLSDNVLRANEDSLGKKGAYSSDAFFSVGETKVDGKTYTVVLTPVGERTTLDTVNFAKYIRINNNNSQVKAAVELTANADGTYTLVFDLEKTN
ncbi:MAG: leucine-rich repeat domain-containing protein [Clostridia bacterium]